MNNFNAHKKSRILIFFILLVTNMALQNIFAIEIVSLGEGCLVARAARHNNLRYTAYPFDWLITPIQSLKTGFQNDFKSILNEEQTQESEDKKSVIDGLGLIFIHDFPTIKHSNTPLDDEIMSVHLLVSNWRDSIDVVKTKFNRRLDRLLQLLHNGEPVALVRYSDRKYGSSIPAEINRNEAAELIRLLKQKFPHAKAVLVVIGSSPEFKEPWGLPHVCNLHIEEKDFRDWDSPAWADVMNKISRLNPQGWSENNPTGSSYILTAPLYGPGLFSVFNTVLGALDWYDRGNISGLSINFGDQGWYYDTTKGENWWNYYFEPVELGISTTEPQQQLFPTYQKIIFAYQSQFEMPRERAYELIQKYIHIRPSCIQQVNNFCHEHFDGFFVIGLHYRGTDKTTEASPISYHDAAERVKTVLEESLHKLVKIFVATDDSGFCSYIKEQFPGLVIMRDALRSDNQIGVHARLDLDPYQKGEDAIIDCLLLSRCSTLIKTASNLSDCSLQFNPKIPVIRLNKSYSE